MHQMSDELLRDQLEPMEARDRVDILGMNVKIIIPSSITRFLRQLHRPCGTK
jgi:hypothetical protein